MRGGILKLVRWMFHYRQIALTTPGKIFFSRSAAVWAFGFPPFKQSSKSKRGCRTGFEYETRAESTKVIFRIPQPCAVSLSLRKIYRDQP